MGSRPRRTAGRHRADGFLQEDAVRSRGLALQPGRAVAEIWLRGLVGRAWRLHQTRLQRHRFAAERLNASRKTGVKKIWLQDSDWRTSTMAKFDLNDDSLVVIIGSGAGGGTLGNELAQKGVKVVILEAGPRTELQDFINNEWESFTPLAWTDMRTTSGDWRVAKDFPNLPAWIVKSVGGSTGGWAGARARVDDD